MSEKTPFVPPELGPLNIRPRKAWAMSADEHWHSNPWYEAPRDDPSLPEVYTYTDAMSYDPGDEVVFHTSTTAPGWTLEIYRDGYRPQTVHKVDAIAGVHTPDAVGGLSHRLRLAGLASLAPAERSPLGFLPGRLDLRARKWRQIPPAPFLRRAADRRDPDRKDSGHPAHKHVDVLQRFRRRQSLFRRRRAGARPRLAGTFPGAAVDAGHCLAAARCAAYLRRSCSRIRRRPALSDEGMGLCEWVRPVLRGRGLGAVRPALRGLGGRGRLRTRLYHADGPALSASAARRLFLPHNHRP